MKLDINKLLEENAQLKGYEDKLEILQKICGNFSCVVKTQWIELICKIHNVAGALPAAHIEYGAYLLECIIEDEQDYTIQNTLLTEAIRRVNWCVNTPESTDDMNEKQNQLQRLLNKKSKLSTNCSDIKYQATCLFIINAKREKNAISVLNRLSKKLDYKLSGGTLEKYYKDPKQYKYIQTIPLLAESQETVLYHITDFFFPIFPHWHFSGSNEDHISLTSNHFNECGLEFLSVSLNSN